MLEGLVATLLNRFLGMYVKNFNAKDLNVGIWSNEVKLRNLELRREALDQLHLPVNVVEGHVGNLRLEIPLSNLRGKPVTVHIEDVFLLAAPKEEAEYAEEEEKRRAHAVKMEKLENAELLREKNSEGMSQEEQKKNQTFIESMVTTIVDNLQVTIKNIHIRYEDSIAAPGHPFALGITLKELSAVSTDANWTPKFIQSSSATTHKLASLGSLAVYWNTDAELIGSGRGGVHGGGSAELTPEQLIEAFRKGIEENESHQYMLRPVSGRAGIEIDKSGKIDKPRVKARLFFNELGFVLDDDQYRDALMMVDLFHYFLRHQEYKKLQPKETPKENPRAWIRFAGQAVLDRIHERERQWTWEYMRERKEKRNAYIDLFKKIKKEEQLSTDEKTSLQELEEELSYEDLRFWRSLARNQLRKENVGIDKKKPEQKQSWGSWIWGSGKKPDQHSEEEEQVQMTEEERQKLMEVIDYDEKKAIAESVDAPREAIKFQVESFLRTGSFTLKRDPHGAKTEVLSLIFDRFQAKALQRTDSTKADISLGGLRLYDGTTPGSLFPQIVKVKDTAAVPKDQPNGDGEDGLQSLESEIEDDPEDKLFHLVFEKNPLDEKADSAIDLKLRSFEIVYNPQFVVEIAKFFKPPERHMESIGALLETAGATVEGIRQQTRAGLEFALSEHKTINANFDIRAPLIIVPESVTEKSTLCLILDAGHASLNSELIDKQTLHDVRSKQKTQYGEDDYKRLENLMYDKFALKLDSTQVLIGPGIEETRKQLESNDKDKNYHLLDRINMDFLLELSILPKDSELTKTRVTGNLPVLKASISDRKYKNLMRLIDIAIPKFADDSQQALQEQAGPKDRRKSKAPVAGDEIAGRPRAKSFQAKPGDVDLFVDEDEQKIARQTKSDGQTSEINLHQRNFEFRFTVEKLQGSLYRADPNGKKPDQLLVELIAEHFHLDFYTRPYDMVAEVVLRSLAVEDYVEQDAIPEFKSIVSSQETDGSESTDLVTVKFVRVQKDSPEFETTYEGIAMNLDVSVSTINVVVTRKTLLTLLDFILITFTNQGPSPVDDTQLALEDTEDNAVSVDEQTAEPDKIRVKADLTRIALILNNDGIRLATLSLNTAHVGVYLAGGAMRVDARLGELTLLDDVNQGASEESSLRKLVAIEGDELADFKYETFNGNQAGELGYDAKVFLRSGSLKVNFVEEPFRKIIGFLVKFGQMQAIFNAARQAAASQAGQMQESASKMHFDILVNTPIIVFPRAMTDGRPRDLITAYLGEIYARNQFEPVKTSKKGLTANLIGAGIRNIRLTSAFHFEDGKAEELEMLDKVDLDFKVKYIEHETGIQRPDMEIEGGISPVNLRISQAQTKFLLELSRSVPGAFAADSDESGAEALKELPRSTVEPAKKVADIDPKKNEQQLAIRSQGPELQKDSESWTKLDLTFKAPTVGLELINSSPDSPVGDVSAASLSIFAINDTSVKSKMLSDGALESELLVHSFTIKDSRTVGQNKFRKVMSLINDDVKQQLMASFTMSAGEDKHLIAMVTLDSPKIIFAMDYVFALLNFASTAFAQDRPGEIEEALEDSDDDTETESVMSAPATPARQSFEESNKGGSMVMSFRVNIEDAQVILIANPSIPDSEAIVLGTRQVLLSQQNATTLQVTKVGMFLCRMDKFDSSRLRILDDFSVTMSMENRSSGPKAVLTTMHLDIEPLVLRLSLRDILLATQIVNKASAMSAADSDEAKDDEPQKLKEAKADGAKSMPTSTKKAKSTVTTKTQGGSQLQRRQTISMRREEMTAEIQGIRVILIGDLHELPLIDWSVKKFDIDVRDWSTALTGDTNINTYINVYNFSKSAWEPLIEPWQMGFHMAKETHPDRLAVELFSHKNMELTITSATIALASKSAQFLSTDEDMLSKPRSSDAPYKIRNYTGFDLDVWAAAREEDQGSAAKLGDGEETPWRFEDATTMRESLTPEGNAGVVGIRLQGSGFDSIQRIHVNREGETLYNLKPKQERIQHRLLVEVKLGSDNVKYITFRSPLLVENNTQIPIELGIFSPEEGHLLKIEKIAPGEGRPAPVGAAFKHSLVVRPDQGFGYAWSNERLFWKDLLKRTTRTITCKGESSNESPPFFFQMNANFNQNDPMTNVYPYMRIKLSAPIELQNLLPFDFKYRIYDKNTKKDWTNFLRKGGISPIHVVELSHLLLLSVEMQDTVFKQSEFAVINSTTRDDFKRETTLPTKDSQDSQLNLKLHYFNLPDSGGAFKVSIYSPYLVLNKTGLDLGVQAKQKYGSRGAGGVGIQTRSSDSESGKAMPYMFSYANDDRKNRAMLKIGDSDWSQAQSLDAIGSSFEVLLPSKDKRSEMHAGVHVGEGEGKYNLTKVVTIAPRFIIKNKIERGRSGEAIQVREPGSGSSSIQEIKSGELLPLRFLRKTAETQICLCFPGVNNTWSSPFNISSVGTMHVKLAKAGQRQELIRADVILEGATLFIHLSIETKHWPFSMRNESETSFMFWQTNPNVADDEEDRSSGWRPIRYRLPKRSIMPYAWDFPAARTKELVIVAYDSSGKQQTSRERRVKLAEIGNLMPLKTSEGNTLDLNIVAEGPTQTLVLSRWKPQKSLYRQKTGTSSQTSVSTGFEVKDLDSDVTFKAELRLQGIGISLINQKVRELLYFTLRGMELKYHDSKLYQTIRATIKWIQIDNQLYGGIFPILLYPSVVPKTGKEMEAHPIFHAQVTRVKDDSYGVLYIKYATLLLQQMTVEIDEDFIYAMLDFTKVPGASWTEEAEGKLSDDNLDVPEPTREQSGQDVYFETLHLQPMQIDLSFVRTERINAEDTATSSNPLMFAVNVLTMSIGNVNDAPLRFNALLLENARVSVAALVANIRDHYTQEGLRQIHVVLGSADFLGNPVGLFNNISSGVLDIFYEPYQGLVMTDRPQELGIGIAKGASSFVKKSVFGFSDSMAKFTGSVAKGMAAATLDKEYQDQRRMAKARNRPKHALYGVTSGGNAFASSLASGIGGLARHPLEGAEQEGFGGFVKGVGKGFLGLATKPAIGAFDLASNLAEGVRNTTTVFDQEGLDRVRLTRFVGLDGIVRPYAQREALGQFWLKTVDDGKYFSEDYIAHLELPSKDMLIMLTYNRIMLVKSKRLKTEWDIKLTDIQTISKERTGMGVTLKGGTNGPFIPVAEEDARNWLYKQIAVAVNAFNDRYNAKG